MKRKLNNNITFLNKAGMSGLLIWTLMIFMLSSCTRKMHQASVRPNLYQIDNNLDTIRSVGNLEGMIAPFRDSMEIEMGSVIGYIESEMPRKQPESTLTHWMGDLTYTAGKKYSGKEIDFAFLNHGGIRVSYVAAGPITVGKVFEIMPFDNLLTVLTLTGEEVQMLFDLIAYKNGGWPVSKQVYVELDGEEAVNIRIHGEYLKADKLYTVATTSFLAEGGDGLDFLKKVPRTDYPVFIRDIIIEDIKSKNALGEKISATGTGRMVRPQ
ncbi:MAG: 5'-nucleotidase C-terminal domain-containing protein [Saprospiraceae bacterium]|nr:5'-nucleotidase C-terminal domain-containing protein [Saprospiraceae bacterium]